jgi:hypothetical protein
MRESRDRRDEITDAVRRGYAEAMVAAGAWKGLSPRRPWAVSERSGVAARGGLTGQELEDWVDQQALRYPGRVH